MRTTSFVSYIYSRDLMSPQTTSTSLIFLRHSLLQHDLRGSFAVEAEGTVGQLDHRTHGFTH